MLYCSLRAGLVPFDSKERYSKEIYRGIPMIIKAYWLDESNYKPKRIPTYAKEKYSYDR
jgi:hypothetical protein